MNDKSIETRADEEKIKALILRTLERERKARFVTELSAVLARSAFGAESLERVLQKLIAEGVIMVRDHFCADPHLTGIDLRIAAPVAHNAGADAQMNAIRAIDAAWEKWLGEYLANHRCS
jgi:hypothetical protein